MEPLYNGVSAGGVMLMEAKKRKPERKSPARHPDKEATSISVLKRVLRFAESIAALDGSSRNEVIQNTLIEFLPEYKAQVERRISKISMN